MKKQLTRSTTDRKISGVCAGLGSYFDIDPTLVRIIVVVLAFPFSLAVIAAYIIAVFVMPNDTDVENT
ncbi:PspC domain-containing protein [Alkalicoccus urumqiensis]|uniref:Phage shock protein PspC N-terminal domain-containing protein n=1 Tax=Alkalicoccus urumqiensis TaxID=1548213 RepID=A0A2P6MH40_ALKUR|nr:PspC domain-containing protein [Alkalicoccus urumqiensis]PRO65602.1 hypothetical protein C6I21_08745 [Alkalicoccus urumqiensis]